MLPHQWDIPLVLDLLSPQMSCWGETEPMAAPSSRRGQAATVELCW